MESFYIEYELGGEKIKRGIGKGFPAFIIAEAGVNHNGSLDLALKLVDAAAAAGADAVKFQTFKTEKTVTKSSPKADYQIANTGSVESQFDMIKKLEFGEEQFRRIKRRCEEKNILFVSTPFDDESIDLLADMDVPFYKIASGEITNYPLIARVASKGKPVIMSTGMSKLEEVSDALAVIRRERDVPIAVLHCVSNYPSTVEDSNLSVMAAMRERFQIPVGWSDHTLGINVAVAAAALGAEVVEKHFTLSSDMEGPDHRASLEPGPLADMVKGIREAQAAIGDGVKRRMTSEENTASVARKSLHAARRIPSGKRLDVNDVALMRPGTGIPANRFDEFVGRRIIKDVEAYKMLREEDFEA